MTYASERDEVEEALEAVFPTAHHPGYRRGEGDGYPRRCAACQSEPEEPADDS